jgi:hypothetical protein
LYGSQWCGNSLKFPAKPWFLRGVWWGDSWIGCMWWVALDIFGWILGTKSWSEDLISRGWAQAGVTIYGFIVGATKPHPHEFIIWIHFMNLGEMFNFMVQQFSCWDRLLDLGPESVPKLIDNWG